MANIKLYKDNNSFHIFNLLDYDESVSYDFSLSKPYTVVLGTGNVSIGTDQTPSSNIESIGLYRVSSGEKLNCSSIDNSRVGFCVSFLIDDSVLMNELVPNSVLLAQLISSNSNLTNFTVNVPIIKIGPIEQYDSTPGNVVLTLNNIESKIIEGLS